MLIGHEKQWKYLTKAAELGKLPHALLFSGQEKLGKKTFAFELVKSINCFNPGKEKKPCHSCRNCQDIEKGIFPDLFFVGLEEEKKEIQISQIRNLIKKLSFRPYSSKFKIAIIDNAHLMNKAAQNSFLKFLEEPRGETVLILISDRPEKMLSTILSRVQEIKFFPLERERIIKYLLEKNVSPQRAEEISSFSFNRPGRAIDFYLSPEKLEKEKRIISQFLEISQNGIGFRFRYIKKLTDFNLKKLKEILDIWQSYLHLVLLSRFSEEDVGRERKLIGDYPINKIARIIREIQETSFFVSSTNINPKIAFENLLIKI